MDDIAFDVARRKIADQLSFFADRDASCGLDAAAHRTFDGDVAGGSEGPDNHDISADNRGGLGHSLTQALHAVCLCSAGCSGVSLPNLTAPSTGIGLKFVGRAKQRMRFSPFYSHRDKAIDAFRRKQMAAVLRSIDFLFDQRSPTDVRHFAPSFPGWAIEAKLDKFGRVKISPITNESAEPVAVEVNRRANAAFERQIAPGAYILRGTPGQIADTIFVQLVLLRDRFALAFGAMRFVCPCKHQ